MQGSVVQFCWNKVVPNTKLGIDIPIVLLETLTTQATIPCTPTSPGVHILCFQLVGYCLLGNGKVHKGTLMLCYLISSTYPTPSHSLMLNGELNCSGFCCLQSLHILQCCILQVQQLQQDPGLSLWSSDTQITNFWGLRISLVGDWFEAMDEDPVNKGFGKGWRLGTAD